LSPGQCWQVWGTRAGPKGGAKILAHLVLPLFLQGTNGEVPK